MLVVHRKHHQRIHNACTRLNSQQSDEIALGNAQNVEKWQQLRKQHVDAERVESDDIQQPAQPKRVKCVDCCLCWDYSRNEDWKYLAAQIRRSMLCEILKYFLFTFGSDNRRVGWMDQ